MKIRAKLNRKVKARSIHLRFMRNYLNKNWNLIEKAIMEAFEERLFAISSKEFSVWDQRKKDMAA